MNTVPMSVQRWGAIAAGQALLSVAAGAFGAHGLKAMVSEQALQWWQTACQYLMYHSLASLFVVVLMVVGLRCFWTVRLFTLGNALFAGSLMVMTLTDMRVLGAITPIGGLMYLLGWALLIKSFLGWNKKVVN